MEKYEPHRETFRKVVDAGKTKAREMNEREHQGIERSVGNAKGFLARGKTWTKR